MFKLIKALSVAMLILITAQQVLSADFKILNSVKIIDQAGREINCRQPFTRIISLYGAHTENLFALGLKDKIVGVCPSETYPPAALNKPVFSYHDGPEKFLAARPDLVLIRPMIERGYGQLMSRLQKSGITVVSLQPNTVKEMLTYWEILGLLTGRKKRAEAMIQSFKNGVQYFQSLTSAISDKKKVYFEAIHDKMKTFSPHSIAVFVLCTAGAINAADDARTVRDTNIAEYGKERILSLGREIDVYLAQKGPMNQPTKSMIRNEPGFEVIKAVKQDQIYIVEEQIVSRPTIRILQGIYTVGNYLYPQKFGTKAAKTVKRILAKFTPKS